jgi:hypothetical protein
VVHNIWTDREKATHLLAILHGQAVDILLSVPTEARYKDIGEELEGWNGDHQLAVAYHSHMIDKSLEELLAAIEQLGHHAFVGLPQYFIWWAAAYEVLPPHRW